MGIEEKSSMNLGEIEENIISQEKIISRGAINSLKHCWEVESDETPPERYHGNTGDTDKSGFNKEGTRDWWWVHNRMGREETKKAGTEDSWRALLSTGSRIIGRTDGDEWQSRGGLCLWGFSNTQRAQQFSKAKNAYFSILDTLNSTSSNFNFIPITDDQFMGCLSNFFSCRPPFYKRERIFWCRSKGAVCENIFGLFEFSLGSRVRTDTPLLSSQGKVNIQITC